MTLVADLLIPNSSPAVADLPIRSLGPVAVADLPIRSPGPGGTGSRSMPSIPD